MFENDNAAYWLSIRARRDPDRVAVVAGDERITYSALYDHAARAAGALAAMGVQRGDRVAVALKNRPEFLEVLFATLSIGAIFVPLNFRLAAEQVRYALEDSGARLIIVQKATDGAVAEALAGIEGELPVIRVDGPDADYRRWRNSAVLLPAVGVEPTDPASIVYTSGTTGAPKGAVLTHDGILTNIHNYLFDWDLRRNDVTIVVNPIFHVVLYILCVPLLYKGGRVVLLEDFDAEEAIRLAEKEKVTVWFAIPTTWQTILSSPALPDWDRRRIRFIGSGGAACPATLMERIAELDLPYRQGYGLSETTSSATTMAPDNQAERPGSVGQPFVFTQARIADNDGNEVPTGSTGEIQLRGRNICSGYWNKPEETAESFDADGWFRTGDLGRMDDEGFIWIVDRKKDVIISGGENIGSIEVEQVVIDHPSVAEAAVIGVPHPHWGETPCAVVVAEPGANVEADALIAFCRQRLAHYKCPTSVVVVDALPKTASGKIAKAAVRKLVERAVPTTKGAA